MTECFSARCQQDRKIIRREFNKWTKNLLLQIGLETISKDHFEFDSNVFDEKAPLATDFDPERACLFCVNRQENLGNKKSATHRPHLFAVDDDENAPLDLSTKSTPRSNVNKHRPFFELKSDIPPIYNSSANDEFDRLMSDIIASQMSMSNAHLSFDNLNLNLFPPASTRKGGAISMDFRIAQLAKQMAYERMLEELDHHRHGAMKKKFSTPPTPSSTLSESFHVNHLLNDVMMRILQEMFDKHQPAPPARASRKGELLFVKKTTNNQDDAPIFTHLNTSKASSSSSSSTSSISSTHSKKKSSLIPRTRPVDTSLNNSKVLIGQDGKQIRPKRGQYRRYESEQLAKAVAAVLSNEMSVHKAGSYFGVPHSTLEYKVKERNIKSSSTTKVKTPVPSPDAADEEERMDCQYSLVH